ncbi:Hypothetical protein NAEGRDRAFT_59396 [Naegleria gruberi]|uniref:F-box domain-containing protein n=1 Tax=Naegleria gruberi TaxID=5762 RepID=D2VWA8_NAEGR|nr:uncharacterized protein NAEGRDRAFT_59396 [Naegleria gruberi]EFC38869.1 Hypothetical protein NAEGRDRAFT_59396 [Naegleria gruberi]|eukprot:XP_002671613.1 Hypothetical protein NAEGRDRAFT_59396 [Naegleria gruberi strain NEG-M]
MIIETDPQLDDETLQEAEKPTTFIQQLNEDVILNIFEFLDRFFVLDTLSTCSQQFHQLAHKPYHYSRLLWKFSFTNYERLDRIKSYYSAVKYIEASDSDRLTNEPIDESRLLELVTFIGEHQETLKGVEIVFNKAQPSLFDSIASACGEWLSELSISVLLDSEFAKYLCSGLHRFKKLKVLRLFIGKSVDANVVLDSCVTMQSMETFETTLYLYSKEHVEKYCKFIRPLRNISIALNCEVFTDNSALLELFTSCFLQGKGRISFHFFNVPSISFLNKFNDVSKFCREMHISIVEMHNSGDEVLSLHKVLSFRVDHAALTANENIFPVDSKSIIFNPSTKFRNNVFTMYPSRFAHLRRLELSNAKIVTNQCLKNLEVVILKECTVPSAEAIIEMSETLEMVHFISCEFSGPSIKCPKRTRLTELILKNTRHLVQQFYLSTLQDLNLTALHLDSFVYKAEELQYLENMSSLEYLNIYMADAEMINTFTIERMINLKVFNVSYPMTIKLTGSPVNCFANLEILKQALIILPPQIVLALTPLHFLQPTRDELSEIILSTFKRDCMELRYFICNGDYIYCVLVMDPGNYATLLIENKAPYNVVAFNSFKKFRNYIQPDRTHYTGITRFLFRLPEKSSLTSKCLTM